MKALVDDLRFVSNNKGTVVHLAKRLSLTEDSLMRELVRRTEQSA
jgi:hypothetical protein